VASSLQCLRLDLPAGATAVGMLQSPEDSNIVYPNVCVLFEMSEGGQGPYERRKRNARKGRDNSELSVAKYNKGQSMCCN